MAKLANLYPKQTITEIMTQFDLTSNAKEVAIEYARAYFPLQKALSGSETPHTDSMNF